MIKRFLRLDFGNWRDRRLKGTYLRYYIQNPEDGRNILARWLDFVGVVFVAWTLGFVLLSGITRIQKALLLSAAFLVVGLILLDLLKRRQLSKKLLHTGRELAKEKYLEQMGKMPDPEFYRFALRTLQRQGIKTNYADDAEQIEETLAGVFENEPLRIRFIFNTISSQEVKDFCASLPKEKFNTGIIVTRDKVSPHVQDTLEQFREKAHVELVDMNKLAQLTAYSDHPSTDSVPEDFWQAKQSQEKYGRQRGAGRFLGTRQKTRGYALSAILLFSIFIFWGQTTPLSLIYLFFALINSCLAAVSLVKQKQRKPVLILRP